MNKIERLSKAYGKFIAVPWRENAAAAQRVVFCVYDQYDERALRARIDEFEIATRNAGHEWAVFDLTDSFPRWMATQRYAQSYFATPGLLSTLLPRYLDYIEAEFMAFLNAESVSENHVTCLKGVGSLFGFLKVKQVVEKLAPNVEGRLLVLFPGSYENNNYRLLNGYDGWNYLATPITANTPLRER